MNKTLISLLLSVLFLQPLSPVGNRSESSGTRIDSMSVSSQWPWSKRIAESFVLRHPGAVTYDSISPSEKWNYEQGLMLEAFHQLWLSTGDRRYFSFIQGNLQHYVDDSGNIRTYKYDDFNLDNVAVGRALLTVYEGTGEAQYKKAADTLRRQLKNQPRTHEGGFWHKQIYPYQMWLDGLFMAEPFYAWYAVKFHEAQSFDDIINQFAYIERHTRDPKTGLLYHGWDESKQQQWANKETGCSPNFWGRAIGWYEMALVDVLDFLPKDHPRRQEMISLLQKVSAAALKYRDKKSHVWYQVVDQGSRKGNYLEASASCMFTYAFAKGAHKGYLDKKYLAAAKESFQGIIKNFISVDAHGFIDLLHTCQGAGLGGTPYRDGSYEYYIGERQRTNDMKGYGPLLLAAIELEK